MGELVAPRWVTALAALIAAVIIALNIKLLYDLRVPRELTRTSKLQSARRRRGVLWACHAHVASLDAL